MRIRALKKSILIRRADGHTFMVSYCQCHYLPYQLDYGAFKAFCTNSSNNTCCSVNYRMVLGFRIRTKKYISVSSERIFQGSPKKLKKPSFMRNKIRLFRNIFYKTETTKRGSITNITLHLFLYGASIAFFGFRVHTRQLRISLCKPSYAKVIFWIRI